MILDWISKALIRLWIWKEHRLTDRSIRMMKDCTHPRESIKLTMSLTGADELCQKCGATKYGHTWIAHGVLK